MSISVLQHQPYQSSSKLTTHSISWPASTTAGSALYLVVDWNEEAVLTTISSGPTGGSGSWALVSGPWQHQSDANPQMKVALYCKENATAQSGSVSITLSSARHVRMELIEVGGAISTSPTDVQTGNHGSSGTADSGTSGTTSQANTLNIAALVSKNVGAQTLITGGYAQLDQTTSQAAGGGGGIQGIYTKTASAQGTINVQATMSSVDWVGMCWAVKEATTVTPTSKSPPRGLSVRGNYKATNAPFVASFSNGMEDINWADLQPVDTNTLATTGPGSITTITNLLNEQQAAGKTVSLRIFAGSSCPNWLKSQVGTFPYRDPAKTGGVFNNPIVQVPKFWVAAYATAWDNLMRLMAAQWDTHPTLLGVQLAMPMTFFAEPFQRHTNSSENRAAMVGGGNDWNGTHIAVPGQGFTFAADVAAHKKQIDIHANRWPNTLAMIAFNPWQVLYSNAEAVALGKPDYSITPDSQYHLDSDDATVSNIKSLIDYMIGVLGPTKRVVLQNNSVRASYFTAGGALITTSKIGQMYQYFVSKPVPRYYQSASPGNVGDYTKSMQGTVTALLANAAEPDTNYSPHTPTEQSGWNAQLLANAVPGGVTTHIPTLLTAPTVTLTSGSGFVPGSVLTTDMGVWDGGSGGITNWKQTWYRRNVTTGALTSVSTQDTYTSAGATDNYTIQAGDVGFQIVSGVFPTNGSGSASEADSSPTQTITSSAAPAPTNLTLPTLSLAQPGLFDVEQASAGTWTNNPTSFIYTFRGSTDGGVTFNGLQSGSLASYQVQVSDIGTILQVGVIASNGTQSTEAVSVSSSVVVGKPAIAVTNPTGTTTFVEDTVTSILVEGAVTPRGAGVTIASFTVNGQAVTIQSDATFSTPVPIAVGQNVITMLATDSTGGTATSQIVVVRDVLTISTDVEDIEIRIHQRGLR